MHYKVAVEKNLNDVQEYFEHKNFQVDLFAEYEFRNIGHVSAYDAIIISGTSSDYNNGKSAYGHTPVIEAKNTTPEEIYKKLM